jgi:hypothetical protein
MTKEQFPVENHESEVETPLEALTELDESIKAFGKHLNKIKDLSPETTSAWQAISQSRNRLEEAIRAESQKA